MAQSRPAIGPSRNRNNAVAQNRADWGVAIESEARQYGLGFIPVQDARYDFVIPKKRLERMLVRRFRTALEDSSVLAELGALGCMIDGALSANIFE